MNALLTRLFQYKAWANDELLTTLASLGPGNPVASLAIKALAHTHVVDRIFAAHLHRRPHGYVAANPDQLPTLEGLSADIRASDQEYVAYVATLDATQLADRIAFTFTDGAPGCMSREEMLAHLITHGAGHRGQVSALLLLNSLPPARDGFTTWLHDAEAIERGRTGREPAIAEVAT
jgi:uncharacterized damage-inducible protein DinB